jgi:hypothetical protein
MPPSLTRPATGMRTALTVAMALALLAMTQTPARAAGIEPASRAAPASAPASARALPDVKGNRANTAQQGRNLSTSVVQHDDGNRTIIRQRGVNHSADVTQTGGGNTQVIIQIGNGAVADVTQTGDAHDVLIQVAR